MEKFFKWLYYSLLSFFVAFTAYVITAMFLAPRQDALERGFIPCTRDFVHNISVCERGEISCPLRYLWGDMVCNVSVVASGFGAWIDGTQKTPWANYIYVPETMPEIADESLATGEAYLNMEELKQNYEKQADEQRSSAKSKLMLIDGMAVTDAISEQDSAVIHEKNGNEKAENFAADDIEDEASFAIKNETNKGENQNEK